MTIPVTVLMSVYNSAASLNEAVQSILSQTWQAFEFVIIDDGSTDSSAAALAAWQQHDERIRVYTQGNQGLAAALNRGVNLAQGEFIARMDADDVSRPNRLAVQLDFLQSRPSVGVCGTWVALAGVSTGQIVRFPTDDATIRSWLLFDNSFAHPSVMIRRRMFAAANLNYDPAFRYSQDYDLWERAAHYTELANVPRALVQYRQRSTPLAQVRSSEQSRLAGQVRTRQLARFGLPLTSADLALHESVSLLDEPPSRGWLSQAERWLMQLRQANHSAQLYPSAIFAQVIAQRWQRVCSASASLGWWTWRQFWRSPLIRGYMPTRDSIVKLTLRCAMRRGAQPAVNE